MRTGIGLDRLVVLLASISASYGSYWGNSFGLYTICFLFFSQGLLLYGHSIIFNVTLHTHILNRCCGILVIDPFVRILVAEVSKAIFYALYQQWRSRNAAFPNKSHT